MQQHDFIKSFWIMTIMVLSTSVVAARRPAPVSLSPEGEKIEAHYSKMLEDLKKEIVSQVPRADEKAKVEFTKQLEALRNVPPITKNVKDHIAQVVREVTLKCDPGNPAFVEKQKEVLLAARAVLKSVDVFLADDKHYANLAKFAFLSHATPNRLAGFAQQGEAERALIDDLLNDDELVAQVMILGGSSNYGQAMRSYRAIQEATKRSHEDFFQTWALAVSLQNCGKNYVYSGIPAEESLVKYYLNYLKAYDDGILDPAFSKLGGTGWNYRFVFPDSYTLEDIGWIRKVMRNYRPDHMRLPYRWRYCRIVRSDVPYGSAMSPARPDLNLSRIQNALLVGGVCGPRAFVGQISEYAFGMPARRAPSPGHGAMAHWTPDGWTTVLGPHFYFCKHINGMPPMEFLLHSQAQEDPEGFKQVLMCEWLGKALGEAAPSSYGSSGGFWPLLGFYKKHAIVEDEKIKDIGTTGEELAESDVSSEKEEIEQIEIPEKFRKITVAEDGTITIPVAACKSPKNGEKILFMESVDGGMQAHYGLIGQRPELLAYTVDIPKAGKYEFTANVCTVTVDRQALLRVNRRTLLDVDIPYTKADWMDTEPVELDLKEGRNRIGYTHYTPNKGVSIKHFTLKPVKMVVTTSGLSVSSAGAGQNEIANTIGAKMALIGPGSFLMGSTTGPGDERPAHRVNLTKGFYMGVTEVTQEQWESVMPDNRSRYKGADRPVTNVTLDDCIEFCKLLTQKERAQGKLPEGADYRLPTEAEWEYACRAGSETKYGFGDSETELGDYAWYSENSVRTQPVGTKKPNAWGLFDVHGNVWEWCSDWSGSYSAGETEDPTGASDGAAWSDRVFRGGSWGSTAAYCRSAARNGCQGDNPKHYRLSGLGFRLVRTLSTQ
ncbi:SUMF1/EgtB/PvdO family nonheme iron enzyme [Akkermansiaceae bacterium]|nr:SUMF1/EgtB/PvdO family nonheme iron enzyme [Akkermansiaceae bacterium]MDB4404976.1 SUMF1/EgtB/PvdO family nonheme iron enzyme [bacterium]MDA7876320.1 SUMF1/EgtB/PvdO family nonheme iron enzyme [Akkermansiaceae bacterium]MDA7896871.1 SUMF1/EgtB/PvdO family nonheme iron enzyme [Akkermansiaceae bacterium]MDA7911426.1 SUMF1/EgtB/PvdO family nonheme iron enzyme [Akkermansiaceae bacterium]